MRLAILTTHELMHFSRELFAGARVRRGPLRESMMPFELARTTAGTRRGRLQFRLYSALTRTRVATQDGWQCSQTGSGMAY